MISNIMAIRVDHRSQKASDVQNILTEYGGIIKLRVGCHETCSESSNEDGIIILHLSTENEKEVDALRSALNAVNKVDVKTLAI